MRLLSTQAVGEVRLDSDGCPKPGPRDVVEDAGLRHLRQRSSRRQTGRLKAEIAAADAALAQLSGG